MKKIVRYMLMLLLIIVIIFCTVKVVNIESDYNKAEDEYENLSNLYTSKEDDTTQSEDSPGSVDTTIENDSNNSNNGVDTNESTDEQENILSQENNYSDYKKIDFESLISLNTDIVGWITVPGTVIDYPIVHSNDNNEYLKLTFQKEYSSSGSIFMDMKNNEDFSDLNTIIYGHNMKNGSMFRSLREYSSEEYYKEHQYVQIYTPLESRTYKIISCYQTEKTSTSYNVVFNNDEEYENWLKEISGNSSYVTNDYDVNKNTITLSTCTGPSGGSLRWVVHLQLVD